MARIREGDQPKLFNFVIEAISPAMIIGMICSLVFFLVAAFYRGEFDLRLMYILGLFTFGVVLITRIAIESGRSYAGGFAIPLALVTILAMMRFVTISGALAPLSWLFNLGLLGLVWYLADRITFDCTLADPKRKIRQEGLLQSIGLVKQTLAHLPQAKDLEEEIASTVPESESKASTQKIKHNPGVWVLRFALLALPLFGIGQLMIADAAARNRAFWFLFAYLAFALGLLVCTSLLSVRQYLHDRGAKMPAEIASIWLASGAIGAIVILLLCILLPLPGRTLGLIELPFELGSPDGLISSRLGWGGEGSSDEQNSEAAKSKSDKGDPSGAAEPDGKGPAEPSDKSTKEAPQKSSDSSKKSNSSPSNNSSDGEAKKKGSGEKGSNDTTSDQQQNSKTSQQPRENSEKETKPGQKKDVSKAKKSDTSKPNRSEKSQPNDDPVSADDEPRKGESQNGKSSSSKSPNRSTTTNFNRFLSSFNADFATLFKWLTILLLALFVIVYALLHPREIAKMLREIADFLAALFGRKRSSSAQSPSAGQTQQLELKRTLAPFSSHINPFQSGERLSGIQIVERTFAALESWAAEAGMARNTDETSREFVGRLVASIPKLGKTPLQASHMLDQVMFAEWKPSSGDLQPLEQLWRVLTNKHTA